MFLRWLDGWWSSWPVWPAELMLKHCLAKKGKLFLRPLKNCMCLRSLTAEALEMIGELAEERFTGMSHGPGVFTKEAADMGTSGRMSRLAGMLLPCQMSIMSMQGVAGELDQPGCYLVLRIG